MLPKKKFRLCSQGEKWICKQRLLLLLMQDFVENKKANRIIHLLACLSMYKYDPGLRQSVV